MKNKPILLLIENASYIQELKGKNITFLFPLKDFSVGFSNPFSLDEIKEEGYLFMNRILDHKGIESFKKLIKDIPSNIKGIVLEDIGILEIVKEENSSLETILYLNHMNSNIASINAYLEYATSVVVSSDITIEETKEILESVKKPVVLFTFGHVQIMYSRRKLLSNYAHHFHTSIDSTSTLEEKVTKKPIKMVENEYGTVAYTSEPFNALELRDSKNVLYYLINTVFLSLEEIKEILSSETSLFEKYSYFYLSKEETIYKVKKEGEK